MVNRFFFIGSLWLVGMLFLYHVLIASQYRSTNELVMIHLVRTQKFPKN